MKIARELNIPPGTPHSQLPLAVRWRLFYAVFAVIELGLTVRDFRMHHCDWWRVLLLVTVSVIAVQVFVIYFRWRKGAK